MFVHLNRLRPGRLLEVGDVLGPFLATTGFTVETIDLWPRKTPATGVWKALAQDIRLLETSERYDAAVSISTLEHIGMGHYGDTCDPLGDRRSIEAVRAALKPGGRFLVTVPLGQESNESWQRLYSIPRIVDLFAGFTLRKIEIYQYRWLSWRRAREGASLDPRTLGPVSPEVTCIALVDAEKLR
ncbi:MAG: DUF268 domain-containing protein [Thermoplasmata archaeon]